MTCVAFNKMENQSRVKISWILRTGEEAYQDPHYKNNKCANESVPEKGNPQKKERLFSKRIIIMETNSISVM